jgi:two-component sensor histidine kinase
LFDSLSRRIVSGRVTVGREIAWAVGCAAIAAGIRWAFDPIFVSGAPFILFVPSVLAASVFAGWRAGLLCLVLCAGTAASFMARGGVVLTPRGLLGETLFLLVGLVTVWLAGALRGAVTQLQARDRQQRLLVAELQHRVKNTLAIVQAIAQQTIRATSEPAQIKADLTDRLVALGQAYNLVVDASGENVALAALARSALQPFAQDPASGGQVSRIAIDGPPAEIPADLAISIALCLHELATNALKHGALSQPSGRVTLTWAFDGNAREPRVRLAWREHDGPRVTPPTRGGFGSRLLKHGLGGGARPVVSHDFAPDGVTWTVDFDVASPTGGV